jgi:hypothetical protein
MYLLRPLHVEKRWRQAFGIDELKRLFVADAEDDAILSLSI